MDKLRTPIEVYKLLPKSNCGACGAATCMAFAAAVIKQEKQLAACTHLDPAVRARYGESIEKQVNLESIQEKSLKDLQSQISGIDLFSRVELLGARREGDGIVVSCLGKDFLVDAQGRVKSQCHTHAWFSVPLLSYILFCRGEKESGRWVPFRELENGSTWAPLFARRCEQPLKEIADVHGELFEDLVSMFSGKSSYNNFSSDISVALYPLPRVPVLICYWKQEGDLESRLHLFFDDTAEKNLPIDSLFTLATGLVQMFKKIMDKHSQSVSPAP